MHWHATFSGIVEASAEQVWPLLRDFSAVAQWHPGLMSSAIDNGLASSQIGATRRLQIGHDVVVRERLEALDDAARRLRYRMLASPFEIDDAQIEIRVLAVDDPPACLVSWRADFQARSEAGANAVVQASVGDGGSWRQALAGLRAAAAPR